MDAMDSSFYISCFLVKMATIDCQVSQWNWRMAAKRIKKNGRQKFLLEWKSTCTDDFKIKNENPAHFLILYSRYTRRFYDWTISLSSPFHFAIPPFSFSLIYCWCCVFLFVLVLRCIYSSFDFDLAWSIRVYMPFVIIFLDNISRRRDMAQSHVDANTYTLQVLRERIWFFFCMNWQTSKKKKREWEWKKDDEKSSHLIEQQQK